MFMRKKCRILIFSVACMACMMHSKAQTGGIYGLVNSSDGRPVQSATIKLFRQYDSSLVKTMLTDKLGGFEFKTIQKGIYFLQITAVGQVKFTGPAIPLATDNSRENAGTIVLSPQPKEMQEAVVTASRPLIENKMDKTVVNVDASSTYSGLSALEVLERSPGVTVDNDGNVSLKGKQGVIILIDGKPTYLNALDLSNYLKNMPANQLSQVEIMSQPPAKYDASGNSGLINLVTKKTHNDGFNGTVTTSAIVAIYFKNTNSLNFNWKTGKINFFGNYGYSYWEGFNDIDNDKSLRSDQFTPFNRYVQEYTFGRYSDRSHTFRIGADLFADQRTTFGVVMNGTVD